MAHADPDPEHPAESATNPKPNQQPDADQQSDPQLDADQQSDPQLDAEAEPRPDPETAKRTEGRFLWMCAWLTAIVGVFLLSDYLRDDGSFSALAWLGVVVEVLCLIGLITAYALCALDRTTLRSRPAGPLDLFQLTTIVMVIAVVVGVLIPPQHRTALALILPFGLSYWLYNLPRTTPGDS
jgi:hypothetical protein